MAVTVSGWKTLPKAGDEVLDGTEADVKKAVANRLRRDEAEALQADVQATSSSAPVVSSNRLAIQERLGD